MKCKSEGNENSENDNGQDEVACVDCGGDDYEFDWSSFSKNN